MTKTELETAKDWWTILSIEQRESLMCYVPTTIKPREAVLHIFRKEVIEPFARIQGLYVEPYENCSIDYYALYFDKYQKEVLDKQPENKFELKACDNCVQMTNHIGDFCQKCKMTSQPDLIGKLKDENYSAEEETLQKIKSVMPNDVVAIRLLEQYKQHFVELAEKKLLQDIITDISGMHGDYAKEYLFNKLDILENGI